MSVRQKILLLIATFCMSGSVMAFAQEKGTGPREKTMREELKSNRRLRQERREKRKLERAERKAIKKHHKRIQTKAVRKRMSASRKKSNRINANKREFFLKRWYNRLKR
ncbi:MAG TPA: hypothetical protein PLQ93_02195 [Bacteroidia bacterium]|nr:hypothetical protein [Bacteroidia bacterium]